MPAPITIAKRPAGYDQTQTRFSINGTIAITGTYTNGTGIPGTFNNIVDTSGNPYPLPPTYNGSTCPGLGVPVAVTVQPVAGYTINYVNGAYRIYNGVTELSTAAVPAAISAAGIPVKAEFLRG